MSSHISALFFWPNDIPFCEEFQGGHFGTLPGSFGSKLIKIRTFLGFFAKNRQKSFFGEKTKKMKQIDSTGFFSLNKMTKIFRLLLQDGLDLFFSQKRDFPKNRYFYFSAGKSLFLSGHWTK